MQRLRGAQVFAFFQALRYASTDCDIPVFVFEHLAHSSESAADIALDVNVARRVARSMRGR